MFESISYRPGQVERRCQSGPLERAKPQERARFFAHFACKKQNTMDPKLLYLLMDWEKLN